MYNRATSVYTASVPSQGVDRYRHLEQMKAKCPVPLAGSGINPGDAFIRFRVANDEEALEAALHAISGPFNLVTGYGIHQREVAPLGRCWNCSSNRIKARPDAGMQGVTDEVVCVACGEAQVTD